MLRTTTLNLGFLAKISGGHWSSLGVGASITPGIEAWYSTVPSSSTQTDDDHAAAMESISMPAIKFSMSTLVRARQLVLAKLQAIWIAVPSMGRAGC